jgi:hypothetical protein
LPKTYKEKEKFKDLIRTGVLKNEDDIMKIEENFEEALKNVNNSIAISQVKIENEIFKNFNFKFSFLKKDTERNKKLIRK